MKKVWRILTVCVVACMTTACGNSEADESSQRVPLPTAWPRLPIEASDSMLCIDSGLPVAVYINPTSRYTILETEPPGLTVNYPKVGTSIFYTFVRPAGDDERVKVLDARKERIALNLNGATADTRQLDGVDGVLVVATSGTQTPVQLLAQKDGYVVTATAFIDDPRASVAYDSLRQVIDVLQHDMSLTLTGRRTDDK